MTVSLSPRQRQVATLIREDMNQLEIAHRLGISARTVENYVLDLRVKTGRASTVAAIADLVSQRLL